MQQKIIYYTICSVQYIVRRQIATTKEPNEEEKNEEGNITEKKFVYELAAVGKFEKLKLYFKVNSAEFISFFLSRGNGGGGGGGRGTLVFLCA